MGPERKEHLQVAGGVGRDDTFWLAFRYFEGELSAEEAKAFEERLAIEQPAREALGEAARLSDLVRAAMAGQPASPSSTGSSSARPRSRVPATVRGSLSRANWRRAASWAAVSAAACLALFLAFSAVWSGGDRANLADNDLPTPPPEPAPQLLARAFPSGMDAWPISEQELADLEWSEEEPVDWSLPPSGLGNDWIALAVVAAQAGPESDHREEKH